MYYLFNYYNMLPDNNNDKIAYNLYMVTFIQVNFHGERKKKKKFLCNLRTLEYLLVLRIEVDRTVPNLRNRTELRLFGLGSKVKLRYKTFGYTQSSVRRLNLKFDLRLIPESEHTIPEQYCYYYLLPIYYLFYSNGNPIPSIGETNLYAISAANSHHWTPLGEFCRP